MATRILVNPANPEDLATVHALQDAITASQPSPGRFEVPAWDEASQKRVRDALTVLGDTLPDLGRTFGSKKDVDPIRHLIGTATAWGGNPDEDAVYLNVVPSKNDGTIVHTLTFKDVPVDGFWSVSVYNAQGYFGPNADDAYTLNHITAKKGADGPVVVQFGSCSNKAPNCLPIVKGVELRPTGRASRTTDRWAGLLGWPPASHVPCAEGVIDRLPARESEIAGFLCGCRPRCSGFQKRALDVRRHIGCGSQTGYSRWREHAGKCGRPIW
jgi:hypothetical protein